MTERIDDPFVTDDDTAETVPGGNGNRYGADAAESTPFDGDPIDTQASERAPKQSSGPRASAAQLISLAWGGAGTALIRSGADVPVGRVLQFQAPLAGTKIDELIRDTWIDHLVQPFVKQADKLEGLGALIMFPVLIAVYERNPAAGPLIEGILVDVVTETLVELGPVIKKRQDKAKRAARSMAGMNDILGIAKDADPVQAVLQSIFAPVPDGDTAPPPEPE